MAVGDWPMKRAKLKMHSKKNLLTPAGRALRRTAKVARETPRAYGTLVYIWRGGKIVAEKP